MREPKTVKGYLKMLIKICEHSSYDLKNITEDEVTFIGYIRASIQNDLGEDSQGVMENHGLIWDGYEKNEG